MLLNFNYSILSISVEKILKNYETESRNKSLMKKIHDMFDINGLTSKELYDFLMTNEEDEKDLNFNVSYCLKRLNKLLIERIPGDSELPDLYSNINYELFENNFKKIPEFRFFYRKTVKFVLFYSIYMEKGYDKKENIKEEDYFDTITKISESNQYPVFFRGQSNYDWNLVPSIIRDFNEIDLMRKKIGVSGTLIDNSKLFKIYSETGMIAKYNKVFDEKVLSPSDIDYRFLSYMQHSISYSPLIDFTKDYKVACSFAIPINSINTYLQKDSCVFILDANGMDFSLVKNETTISDVNTIINKLNVRLFNKKIKPGTKMYIDNMGSLVEVDFTSLKKIKDNLTPRFQIISSMTNDRMKYQKGCFILFYDYVSVNGNILYELVDEFTYHKHRIRVDEKHIILKKLDGYYNQSDLLNPYQIFNDNKI